MGTRFRLTASLLVLVMALGLGGCSSSNDGGSGESESSSTDTADSADAPTINIEDIDWSVDSAIEGDERVVDMRYTNNTPYPIAYFRIEFKGRDDLTDEELEKYYDNISKDFSDIWSKDDIKKAKKAGLSANGACYRFTPSGEKSNRGSLLYYDAAVVMKNIDHYKLLQPDIATIKYVSGDKLYTTYYDYATNKYSVDDEIKDLTYWPDDVKSIVPKPDAKYILNDCDYDEYRSFDVLGGTLKEFNAYTKECKNSGFTVDPTEVEDYLYSAKNEEGYKVDITYDETGNVIYVNIHMPTDN